MRALSAGSRRRLLYKTVGIVLLLGAAAAVTYEMLGSAQQPAREPLTDLPTQSSAATLQDAANAWKLAGSRQVHPYSVVPGGVYNRFEVQAAVGHDPVVATHYRDFEWSKARLTTLATPRRAYVSYRLGNEIYWTAKKITLPQGEAMLSDGANLVRARCGNRISEVPRQPVSKLQPPPVEFDGLPLEQLASLPGFLPPVAFDTIPLHGTGGVPGGPGIPFIAAPIVPLGGAGPSGRPDSKPNVPGGNDSSPEPVPEPGTMTLVALGAGAYAAYRKKIKAAQ